MAKKTKKIPVQNEELYDALMTTVSGIEVKGATMPYTSLNGNMFSFLKDCEVALRLPEKEREQFIKKHKSKLFEAYGIIMKEYVTIPASLLKKTKELAPYATLSFEYAKTLKTKPTKKK